MNRFPLELRQTRHRTPRFSASLRATGRSVGRTGRVAAIAALVSTLALPATAQFGSETRDVTRSGTSAAEFLGIPVGARGSAMGSAITASVDDATAIYWNPAGLGTMTDASFLVEHAEYFATVDFNFVSFVLPTSAGTIGAAVTVLSTPEMEVTTVEEQNGTGETFNATSYALSLSFARSLTDRFSIGATAKLISERIWHSHATGLALDIGTLFVTPFNGIRLGAAISNFGTKMRMAGDDLLVIVDIDPNAQGNNESNRAELRTDAFDLPLTMRIGLAGEVFQNSGSRLTLTMDALSPNNSGQFVNLGAELGLLGDLFMIRGGLSEVLLSERMRSFTAGAGVRYDFGNLGFAADYAYEGHRYFDGVNRFTLAMNF